MMAYTVKEIYTSIQGEGAQTGRAAVLCRFAGCNLWSGREQDRAEAACNFCDTDFEGSNGPGGDVFESHDVLAAAVARCWGEGKAASVVKNAEAKPFVICTGGEPLLQLDEDLIAAFHDGGFEVAVETNGTLSAPPGLDWICVRPKAETELTLLRGDELKLVYPQQGASPEMYENLDFRHFLLQPIDGEAVGENTRLAVEYCLAHPGWRLSLQTHKFLGIP